MKPSFIIRLDGWARRRVPFLLTVLFIILGVLPIPFVDFSEVKPFFPIISVFYWAIHRPDLFGIFSAFITGILADLITGVPLGVNTLIFVTVYSVVFQQRRFFLVRAFIMSWWGFSIVSLSAVFLEWLFISIIFGHLTSPIFALFSYFMTAALYPVFSWFCARSQTALLMEA